MVLSRSSAVCFEAPGCCTCRPVCVSGCPVLRGPGGSQAGFSSAPAEAMLGDAEPGKGHSPLCTAPGFTIGFEDSELEKLSLSWVSSVRWCWEWPVRAGRGGGCPRGWPGPRGLGHRTLQPQREAPGVSSMDRAVSRGPSDPQRRHGPWGLWAGVRGLACSSSVGCLP